jgi:predicted HicB family RNase H-like nuclease
MGESKRRHEGEKQLNIWVPCELHEDLVRVALAQGTSMAQILRGYARRHIEEFDAQTAAA